MTDPQRRQEVATTVGRNLRANPPGDSSVDDVETAFAAASFFFFFVLSLELC